MWINFMLQKIDNPKIELKELVSEGCLHESLLFSLKAYCQRIEQSMAEVRLETLPQIDESISERVQGSLKCILVLLLEFFFRMDSLSSLAISFLRPDKQNIRMALAVHNPLQNKAYFEKLTSLLKYDAVWAFLFGEQSQLASESLVEYMALPR